MTLARAARSVIVEEPAARASGTEFRRKNRSAAVREIAYLGNIQPMEDLAMSFRITGLPAENFSHLFAMSDAELAAHGAVRRIADDRVPGYPCRISLTDSRAGDELVLVNYEHHAVDSPYRMRFAIYVRRDEQQFDAVDRVPEQLRLRTLAVRAFDADAMLIGHGLVEGGSLEPAIERRFADPRAAYLHVHFAAPGCYAARVERA